MRRKLVILISLLLTFSILSGCIGEMSDSDKAFRQRSREKKLSGSIITIMATNDWIKEAQMDLASNFEAATGIEVRYEIYQPDEYLNKLWDRLDNGSSPDIFLMQSGLSLQKTYQIDKYAVSLENEPWMEYYDHFTAENTSVQGINYGMTYYDTTTDYYLIYNKKIFSNAGVTSIPTTFSEFEAACSSILANGITPIYEPMADGWHQTMMLAEIGHVYEAKQPGLFERLNKNEATFANNPNIKKALEQIKLLSDKGYFGSTYATDKYENAAGFLATGEYAMCMLKPGAISAIADSDLNLEYKHQDFGLMLMPICDNQYLNIHPTGPSHFISKSSKNIEAAKLYLEYMATKDNIQYVIDKSSAIENLPFNAGQNPKYDTTTEKFINSFSDSNSGIVLQDKITYFNEQWDEISADILKMCQGQLSTSEVLQNIDARRSQLAKNANDPFWQYKKN